MQYPIASTILCLALVVASFCRARHTSRRTTAPVIRWVISLQGMAATAGAAAPWLLADPPPWLSPGCATALPDWIVMALIASMAATQAVTSHLWRAGVPGAFRRPVSRQPASALETFHDTLADPAGS
jgi:hypothetical protein